MPTPTEVLVGYERVLNGAEEFELTGTPLYWDLRKDVNIGFNGGAGSGKSTAVEQVLRGIERLLEQFGAAGYADGGVDIANAKRLGYWDWVGRTDRPIYECCDWRLSDAYAMFMRFMADGWADYERRMDLIYAHKVDDWYGAGLAPRIRVLEETNALFIAMGKPKTHEGMDDKELKAAQAKAKAEKERAQEELVQALCLWRASGVILVLIQQNASGDFLPTAAKTSISGMVCLGSALSNGDFMSVFGTTPPSGFKYKGGVGQGIARLGGRTAYVQVIKETA
jgi:hypothetical protein